VERERKSTMGQVLAEWESCVDLDQFLSRVLVFIQLRPEHVEQRHYLLFRAQTIAGRAHDWTKESCAYFNRWAIGSCEFVATCCSPTFMSYAPKPGCPMCGIVNTAFHSQINSLSFDPSPQQNKPEILWKDENFTVYRETTNPVSSIAHIIIAFKCVLPTDPLSPLSPPADFVSPFSPLTAFMFRLYTDW